MARSFEGRGSEALYNAELYKLYEAIQHLLDMPETDAGPYAELQGALWLDRSSGGGDLKFRNNGVWENVFGDKFKIICEILSDTEPKNPVLGQLWLDNGILKYFSGVDWIPVKSVNVDTNINLSVFEQFLLIAPVEPAGKKVINPDHEIINGFIEEVFQTTTPKQQYILTKGECSTQGLGVKVYVNGNRLPKTYYQIINSLVIEITETLGESPAGEENIITIIYQNNKSEVSIDATHSQFLIPSVDLDRVFINGYHDIPTSFYEECNVPIPNDIIFSTISNIALEYPTDDMINKSIAAVHVNPKKLTNITKKMIKINNNGFIPVVEWNTEFYAVKDGICKLLTKKPIAEYTATSNGIILSQDIVNKYDFIYAITYEFDSASTGIGELYKNVVILNNNSSIYIGEVEDPSTISVFTQGLYLDPVGNYEYDNGYINIKLPGMLDIGIIVWPKKETGTLIDFNNDGKGVITTNLIFEKPLIMVYGFTLTQDFKVLNKSDYTIEQDPNGTIKFILSESFNQPGLKYAIVETKTYDIYGDVEEDMIISSGTIIEDINGELYVNLIKTNADGTESPITNLDTLENVILFANGLLIAKNDVEIDTANGRIYIKNHNFIAGMDYTLLRDDKGRYIHSNKVSFNTLPLPHKSDATLVYIENQLLTDANDLYSTYLPTKAYNGEVKLIINDNIETWYIYNNGWQKVTENDLLNKLDTLVSNYMSDEHAISILKKFGEVECVYYSYTYANSIEYPLLVGNIRTSVNKTDYRVAFNHLYPYGHNSLAIWQNGLRQYPNLNGTKYAPDGIYELADISPGYFRVAEPIDGIIFYVVEKPEAGEKSTCNQQILTENDLVQGTNNLIFNTNINLAAGNVRLFISGLRQPESVYKIIDSHTILIDGEILCGSNFPISKEVFNNQLIEIVRTYPDTILIESRSDYNLKEITLPIRYDGQNEFLVRTYNKDNPLKGGDSLPESIINSKDFIMIYINGLAYGKNYTINKEKQSIILNDTEYCSKLTSNDFITFEWR